MGEFDRIARFLRHFPRRGPGVVLGAGDDCAVVRPRTGFELCLTTDSLVQDVHFSFPAFSPADVGHKALAVNLSDLAAMGARPSWFLCALELPRTFDDRALDALGRGMAALAKASALPLVGGNVTSAAQLSVTLTLGGEVPGGGALTRSGGRPGDLLYVSGELGGARLGLEQLAQDPRAKGAAVRRQKRPGARLSLGALARRFASAGLDVSDGLMGDLAHLCASSKTGALVQAAALPVSPALRRAKGEGAALFAAAGGEDYELLLAVRPPRAAAFERACRRAGERVTRVGELTGRRALVLRDASGRAIERPSGYDHFESHGRRIDRPSGGK